MIIETKIKWSFAIVLLITVFVSNYKSYKSTSLQSGAANAISFVKGKENVQLLFNVKDEVKDNILIESYTNNWKTERSVNYPKTIVEDMLLKGMLQKEVSLSKGIFENAKSGIYLVNKTIPFVLKEELNTAEVTIVYPYMNNAIYEHVENNTVFTKQLTSTSFNRPQKLDKLTSCMQSFFNDIELEHTVSYISDLDLEVNSNFDKSKILIFYGDFGFATKKMKENILNFIQKGGKIIISCTKFLNNTCQFSIDENYVSFNKLLFDKGITNDTKHILSNYNLTGRFIGDEIGLGYGLCHPLQGNKGFEIRNSKHKIFQGIENSNIPISSNHFIGGYITNGKNNLPFFDQVEVLASYNNSNPPIENKGEIGILECKINNGVLLSLGTKDWFKCNNYNSSQEIQTITKNAIDYLLEN